jgi:8-amino-7-oxononanoate synthase
VAKNAKQPPDLRKRLERELSTLKKVSQYRSLSTPARNESNSTTHEPKRKGLARSSIKADTVIDFTSNDYLGLARNAQLRIRLSTYFRPGISLSASGSRLLRGNYLEHEALETRFAQFVGAESSLMFNSGYDANIALLTTLPTRHDTILLDRFVHASIKEGAHSSLAQKFTFEHNSIESLRSIADRISTDGNIYVVVESIYSMDGDEAPLIEIAALCEERGYHLIVDEAHATGVVKRSGRGLVEESGLRTKVMATVHTCGKALGAAGALVACSTVIKEYLINKSRPFIYTTALPPAIPWQIIGALDYLEARPDLLDQLQRNADYVRERLTGTLERWQVIIGRSPIVAVVIGDESETLMAAAFLQESKLDVRALRPPSVPDGTSRLRIVVHADHVNHELTRLCDTMIQAETACKA